MSAMTDAQPTAYALRVREPARAWRVPERASLTRLRWALSDVQVLTWRTLARIAATPEQVLNVTALPLVFVLLFSYVFNGAIVLPGPGSYRDYLIAGVVAVNMGSTAQGAAIGLAVDLSTGLIDRFRSLPMSRAAVIAGRTLADLITTVLALLFGYAAAWVGACAGILARGPEAAQAVGLTVIVPLSLTSNAFISTAAMPGWLQAVADWNPVSVLASACRQLLGNPDPAAAIQSWPMRHPELASALWSLALLAVMAPLTVWLYVRRNRR
jgi:ABC-2 type transport system permease protein